jgi:hypothetical protein
VQLLQREEPRVDPGEQAGVKRAEEPGPRRGIGGPQGASPLAYAASISRASWFVTTAVSSSPPAITCPWYVADRMPRKPMTTAATVTSERRIATSKRRTVST